MSIVHEHLWRTVLDVGNEVLFSLVAGEPLPRMEELRTSEVPNPNMAIVANEYVIWLDVMVYNAQRMECEQPSGLKRGEGDEHSRDEARTSSTATSFILFSPRWVAQAVRSPISQKSCDECLGEGRDVPEGGYVP